MDENKKLDRIIEFLNDQISELTEYTDSEDFDELEKHDCNVAIETYELVLNYVKDLKK